jgi:hypothetical protein
LIGFVGLDQPSLHCDQIVAGQQGRGQLSAAAKGAVLGQPFQDFRIFEHTQGAWIHKVTFIPTISITNVTAIIS